MNLFQVTRKKRHGAFRTLETQRVALAEGVAAKAIAAIIGEINTPSDRLRVLNAFASVTHARLVDEEGALTTACRLAAEAGRIAPFTPSRRQEMAKAADVVLFGKGAS